MGNIITAGSPLLTAMTTDGSFDNKISAAVNNLLIMLQQTLSYLEPLPVVRQLSHWLINMHLLKM